MTKKFVPYWKQWCIKNNIHLPIKSKSWCVARVSGGSCWGGTSRPVLVDDIPEEFTELDEILENVCPNITFLQYNLLKKRCCTLKDDYDSDYYGNSSTYRHHECDAEKLYDYLQEKFLIKD